MFGTLNKITMHVQYLQGDSNINSSSNKNGIVKNKSGWCNFFVAI